LKIRFQIPREFEWSFLAQHITRDHAIAHGLVLPSLTGNQLLTITQSQRETEQHQGVIFSAGAGEKQKFDLPGARNLPDIIEHFNRKFKFLAKLNLNTRPHKLLALIIIVLK